LIDYDQGKANVMLNMIQKLYQIERSCNGQSFELILQTRKQHAIPVLDKMKKWLDANLAMNDPPNPIQKAIRYMLKRWNGLTEYVNYYNRWRPHRSLGQRAPCAQAPPSCDADRKETEIIARSVLGGLHHVYDLAA